MKLKGKTPYKASLVKAQKAQQSPDSSFNDNTVSIQRLFTSDGIYEYNDYLLLGPSQYCRVYALSVYPRDVYIGWLDDVFALGDIDVSIHVDPVPDRQVINKLTEIVASARAQHSVLSKQGNILMLPELEQAIVDTETVREAIQTNRDRMFYATIYATVHARSVEELNQKCDSVEDALAKKSARLHSLIFQQLEGIKSCFPGSMNTVTGFTRNVTTGGLTAMFPVSNPDISHQSGIYLGSNYFTGSPVLFDQFIGPPQLPNQHIAVFGWTGSGKSVTLKLLVSRSVVIGVRVVILDNQGEYDPLVSELMGGSIVYISAGQESGINPLDIEPEIDEKTGRPKLIDLHEKVSEVRALLNAISSISTSKPLDARDAALLEEVVREEYASREITSDPRSLYQKEPGAVGPVKKSMPTLSSIHERLESKSVSEELKIILKPYLRGNSLGMFDCQTKISLKDRVISFNLKNINDESTKLFASSCVLSWVRQKFIQRDLSKKMFVVDEGWSFIKRPEAAPALEIAARTGRKFNTSLVVASQFPEEFLNREEGRAVIGNCASIILLRQHPTVVDQVVDAFHLSSGASDRLSSFAPGECILWLSGTATAIRIQPTPFEWSYVTTNPQEIVDARTTQT